MDQLLLQTDRMGTDHNASRARALFSIASFVILGAVLGRDELRFGFGCVQDGWNQVTEALANPRARFDNQMPALAEGLSHRGCHLHLFAAMFVVGDPFGDATTRTEDRFEIQWVHAFNLVVGWCGTSFQVHRRSRG